MISITTNAEYSLPFELLCLWVTGSRVSADRVIVANSWVKTGVYAD